MKLKDNSLTGYSDFSFLATFDTNPVTPGNPIVFNYPVHNAGGHYNPTTGIYITPIDGIYEFIFRIRADNIADAIARFMIDDGDVGSFSITHIVEQKL